MRVRGALAAFLHQAILKALKEHPEGISPAYFNNMESEGVDLSDPRAVEVAVAVAMKDLNVLTCHMDLLQYVMLSRCHELAIRTYEPIVPPSPANFAYEISKMKAENVHLTSRWWSRFL